MNEGFKAANTALKVTGNSSSWKFTCYKKFNGWEGFQINSWRFKAQISWSQSDGDKMDYSLCANK